MAFAIDIGMKRSMCVQFDEKDKCLHIDSYLTLPGGVLCKIGNKSITLNREQWIEFVKHSPAIMASFQSLKENAENPDINLKVDLGKLMYLRICGGIACVHIRKYYMSQENSFLPGVPGVGMKIPEFEEFVKLIPSITSAFQ